MIRVRILSVLAGLFAVGLLSAATPDIKYYQPRELIQVSTDDVQISFDQSEASVFVTANSPYELYCRSKWLTASEKDGLILITAQKNDSFVPRTARIILTTKKENVSRVVTVTQKPEPGHDQFFALPTSGNFVKLADLDLSHATHDKYIKEILIDKSVDGHKIKIKNNTYESAIATHAPSVFKVKLNGAMRFVCDLGIDDEILNRTVNNHGNALYKVLLDGKEVAAGRITILDKQAVHLDINTHGAKMMQIEFDPDGSNWGDHIDLGNPYFELTADKPEVVE